MQIRKAGQVSGAIARSDVETGLGLVQVVYGIAVVLGFRAALGPAYRLVFPPTADVTITGRHVVVLLCLAALLALGLRFFWVPRNLWAYLLQRTKPDPERRLRLAAIYHVPVIMVHALLFYMTCQAFADLASTAAPMQSVVVHRLSVRFVGLYATLLLVNAVWLLILTPFSLRKPTKDPLVQLATELEKTDLVAPDDQSAQHAEFESILFQLEPGAPLREGSVPRQQPRPPTIVAPPGAPVSEARTEWIWGFNNTAFGLAAYLLVAAYEFWSWSAVVFLVVNAALFLSNSFIDLRLAAEDYLVFPKALAPPAESAGSSHHLDVTSRA